MCLRTICHALMEEVVRVGVFLLFRFCVVLRSPHILIIMMLMQYWVYMMIDQSITVSLLMCLSTYTSH